MSSPSPHPSAHDSSPVFNVQMREHHSVTLEAFEKLKGDYEAAQKWIARLERELEDYEIDIPLRSGEEDSEVSTEEELEEVKADGEKEDFPGHEEPQPIHVGQPEAEPELEISAGEANEADIPRKKHRNWLEKYFRKWKGEKFRGSAKYQPWDFMVFSFIGSFICIGIIGLMSQYWMLPDYKIWGIIPSFGASAVLVFGTESPLAQPRAVLGGHFIAALVGTIFYTIMKTTGLTWLMGALSVAVSIVLMQVTKTIHPPAGATALIAVIGPPEVKAEGFLYVIFPTTSGAVILVLIGLLVMNIKYRYPKFWW